MAKKIRRRKYVYLLKKYLPMGSLDIAASTNKAMILKTAKKLVRNLPEEKWSIARAMPFHQGRSDKDLRQFLKDNPDPTYYGVVIYDNKSGESVDSTAVTRKVTLAGY